MTERPAPTAEAEVRGVPSCGIVGYRLARVFVHRLQERVGGRLGHGLGFEHSQAF
ncbi:hypothetical protein [Streptomyces ziwulingensis]|uniref:hypothetical protein n=1 Tax=Streptomyces ziwulingensis TaxID=1045501 RepID=UPI0031EC6242